MRAVVYDLTDSHSGEHARALLGAWGGSIVGDDYAGDKSGFAFGMTEAGCMAHVRCKSVALYLTNRSTIARTAIDFIKKLYGIKREVKEMAPLRRLQ